MLFWAACCVAFFGSFRMSEILPCGLPPYSFETLTWDRVNFTSKNSAVINIRFPKKVRRPQGDFIDIFEIPGNSCYPYSALRKLYRHSSQNVKLNLPVFCFSNGAPLTAKNFTTTLRSLLAKHIGPNSSLITGHSFWAAKLAALANHPSLASDHAHLCQSSRWWSPPSTCMPLPPPDLWWPCNPTLHSPLPLCPL